VQEGRRVQLLARVRLDAISLPARDTWMDEWMDGIQAERAVHICSG